MDIFFRQGTSLPKDISLRRMGKAFLAIEGVEPASMPYVTGCRWPIYDHDLDPLKSPTADLFCDGTPAPKGDGFHSYCEHHCRVAYRFR